jgi:nucleoside-diphosphate-sugar epimerase
VIPTFLRASERGQALRVVNGGCARFNFVYVSDVAVCTVRALESGSPGIYNVASGEHTSLRELTDSIVALSSKAELSPTIEPLTPGAFLGFPPLSIDKARQAWHFAPRSIAAGLRDYRASLLREPAQ